MLWISLLSLLTASYSLADVTPVGHAIQILQNVEVDRETPDTSGTPYFHNGANCWRDGRLVNPADPINAPYCQRGGRQENCILRVNSVSKTALRKPQGRVDYFLSELVSEKTFGPSYYQGVLELRLDGASSASLSCYSPRDHIDRARMQKLAEGLIKIEP